MKSRSQPVWAGILLCIGLITSHQVVADSPALDATLLDATAKAITGNWLTEPKDGIIQLTIGADGKLEGRIVGGNAPERTDEHNPDASRRSALLRGQAIVHDLSYDGDGHWSGGTIYDPDSGRTYRCKMTMTGNDKLEVRGFIGFALLGRTQTWTRYNSTTLDLPAAK